MRKLFTFLVPMTIGLLLTITMWAQPPQKMSYQAVIRNSTDALVTNTKIGIEINIRQGSQTGTVVYTETQTPTTNANGLVSIEIGGGAGFSAINWASDNFYIETKTAIVAPLTSYTITSVTQLLSVPYALNAKTAENGITTAQTTKLAGIAEGAEVNIQANWNQTTNTADDYIKNKPVTDGSETKVTAGTNVKVTGSGTTANPYVVNATSARYLGEEYLGGIIFYLYTDNTGTQKGLIVSKTESEVTWSGNTLVGADRTEDGAYNTKLMPAGSTAKAWVRTLGAGWYLPSIDELGFLWHNRFHVNKTARAVGSTLLSTYAYYWSSTECFPTVAFLFAFDSGLTSNNSKTEIYRVRAVRAF
jgi:hypothetical protein